MALTDQQPWTAHVAVSAPPPPALDEPAPASATKGRLGRLAVAGTALALSSAAAAYTFTFDPNNAASVYPQCWLKAATGIDCPGCGGLRATHSLLHGDLAGAVDHNVLALVMLPLGLYFVVRYALQQFDIDLPAPRMRPWLAWTAMAVVIVFTVVRNTSLPIAAFLNSATA